MNFAVRRGKPILSCIRSWMKRTDRGQRSLGVKVCYQADADLDRRIVNAVRRTEPNIDFRFASEARSGRGLKGLLDDAVLAIAAEEGRILVTHDRRTMPRYFAEFITTHMSPGVLIIPRRMQLSDAVEWLVTIWVASEAEEWRNQILPIPR